jgi:hypothetical protein
VAIPGFPVAIVAVEREIVVVTRGSLAVDICTVDRLALWYHVLCWISICAHAWQVFNSPDKQIYRFVGPQLIEQEGFFFFG